ncbi:hypothetical protein AAFF_G00040920, partial [Aldrovandia affinis]
MDYVLVRAPPPQPGLPRPRLSLYLSSQLQYGIVIVYHRQCAILLEEIQQTIDRLMRSANSLNIDLVKPDRLVLTLPDSLSVLEESERAQDPFFGVMEYTLPSPSALIQFDGVELAEVTSEHTGIIEMLMEQQDQFPEEVEEKEQEREAERMIEQQRTTALAEQLGVTAVAGEDPVWMPEEVTGLSAEVPAAAPLERTPVSAIPLPCSPDRQREGETQEETFQVRGAAPKKRRRQLLFIDKQIQIPHGELQEMIQDTLTETQPHLYHPALHPDILALWKEGAVITPLSSAAARKRVSREFGQAQPEVS